MRKVVLYIAMSLDGYIADKLGDVDFLYGHDKENKKSDYDAFIKTIDTVLLGRTTYDQIVNILSTDVYPYKDLKSYVITSSPLRPTVPNVLYDSDPINLIRALKKEAGKDIWIIGGAKLINPLIKADLIDRYQIYIIPTILGQGIKLFDASNFEKRLTLVSQDSFNGIVKLVYNKV